MMRILVLGVYLSLVWNISPCSALYTVPVGVILVEDTVLPFSLEILGPVTDMAVERMRDEVGIDLERHYGTYPVMCDASLDVGWLSTLYHQHDIRAVIGPTCSVGVEAAAQLATFYQLPLVTGVGDLVLDMPRFPTFTRLSYSIEKQSMCIKALLERFGWRHVAILFHATDILLRLQGDSLRLALRKDPNYPMPYDFSYVPSDTTDHRQMLLTASRSARVILITTTGDEVRKFLLAAQALGFTNGDYVFITVDLYRTAELGAFDWRYDDQYDELAREAFESLFIFTLKVPEGEIWEQFKDEVIERSFQDFNYTLTDVNYYIGASYDSVIYLALAYNATLERGLDPTNGLTVAQALWNTTFQGVMGEVYVDEVGDRIADYSVLDLRENGDFEVVANYLGSRLALVPVPDIEIRWPNDRGPPPDIPKCGFLGDDPACEGPDYTMISIVTVLCILAALLFVAAISFYVYRKAKFESDLADMGWRLTWSDVIMRAGNPAASSKYSLGMETKSLNSVASAAASGGFQGQVFTTVATHKGAMVAVRRRNCTLTVNRDLQLEMKQMRDVQHDNLTRFVGAILETDTTAVLTEYCPKGSLQDILMNESIKLDWTFRYSLINDIISGLGYLHQSTLRCHGRLTSSNCVVDGRFVLKLTDYGLPSFYYAPVKDSDDNEMKTKHDRLWRAPECVTETGPALATGDIYSFAIVLHEIVSREMPYDSHEITPTEVIRRVLAGETPPFRPRLTREMCEPELYDLIEACWAQDPFQRPTLAYIKSTMKAISRNKSGSTSLLDNLLQRMEQYAENLEALVEERTQAFQDEKKKSEELLYRVLPKAIAEQLKQGKPVSPEKYECVTIYFSDIVGFTALSAASTPIQVIDLLNDLYTCFDAVINSFDVYKVETIGDAYMVVSGLPMKNGDKHASQIARMSLRLLDEVKRFRVRHRPQEQLKLRIGLHSGPCCAGVVGLTMPRYCLFGDTVNTASRMESNGEAMKIHVSPTTTGLLDKHGMFDLSYRGEIPMKGKGVVKTYWLNGIMEQLQDILDMDA